MTLQDEEVFILKDTSGGRSDLTLRRFIGKLIVACMYSTLVLTPLQLRQGLLSG